jgi:hypothetical protein
MFVVAFLRVLLSKFYVPARRLRNTAVEYHRHFGGTYCFHLQSGRINHAKANKKQAAKRALLLAFLLFDLFFDPDYGDRTFLRNFYNSIL